MPKRCITSSTVVFWSRSESETRIWGEFDPHTRRMVASAQPQLAYPRGAPADATAACGSAPVVVEHAQVFRELFENRCQFQHFENYLTGLMVLANKSMANISRCLLESADKTNLSRFFSEAPWEQEQVNEKRISPTCWSRRRPCGGRPRSRV